jgi:hypothetical protein
MSALAGRRVGRVGRTGWTASAATTPAEALARLSGLAVILGILILASLVAGAEPNPRPSPGPADGNDGATASKNPHVYSSRVASVAVFKNGLGFFLREGDVELRDGWCIAKEVPPAAFGTLAIFAHDKDQTVDVVGSGPGEIVDFDGTDAPKDAESKRKRLSAYRDVNVQVKYKHAGAARSAAGNLQSVEAKYVILESETSTFAIPLEEVTQMQVLDLPVRVHVLGADNRVPAKATLGMAYLRKGITWIPEYTLTVLDDDTAELTLRGTVVNEAEDLVHCDVSFVVGVPHFAHTDFLAPIAVGQIIRTIGAAIAPSQIASQIMNRAALVSQNASREMDVVAQPVAPAEGDLGKALGSLPPLEVAAGSDYTVYTKKDLTIRRGEKAIVTLFRTKIKYSHVYRWSPPSPMEHLLVLQNSTDTAWTTGPCLAVSDGKPLGEDLLKYVPKGGAGEMPVTAAINIAQEKTETEAERKLKVHEPSKDFFLDLVTIKGKLQVKNFEKRPATVVIAAPIPGKPLEAGDEGAISIDSTKLQLLERSGSIRWRLTLDPGGTKTLTYVYERYVPSK